MSDCKHENFVAAVDVSRLEDVGRFVADVRIKCAQCDVPMRFLGLPLGVDLNSACVSYEGTVAQLGIAPLGETVPPINGVEGFTIRKTEKPS